MAFKLKRRVFWSRLAYLPKFWRGLREIGWLRRRDVLRLCWLLLRGQPGTRPKLREKLRNAPADWRAFRVLGRSRLRALIGTLKTFLEV